MKDNYSTNFSKKLFLVIVFVSSIVLSSFAQSTNGQIKGTVLDNDGHVIPGITVTFFHAGKRVQSTFSNEDGIFTHNGLIQDQTYDIHFTGLGYEAKIYKSFVVKVNEVNSLIINLQISNKDLDEVVVVGFQTQKLVNVAGAISTVSSNDLENRPVTNIAQALKSQMPGLNVSIPNGNPKTFADYNIRGGTSMYYNQNDKKYLVSNGNPLILVDGIEVENFNLSTYNPNDIESITVLKDASSSAIYGARAAFGVMLVTTKKGKIGKPVLNYSFDIQTNQPAVKPRFMDAYTAEYAQMIAREYEGSPISDVDREKLAAIKKFQENRTPENAWMYVPGSTSMIQWVGDYDPYEGMFKNNAYTQKHNLSVRGGTDLVKYFISGGYMNQTGLYKPRKDLFERYNGVVNLDIKLSEKFNLGLNLSQNYTDYDEPASYSYHGNPWSVMLYQRKWHANQPTETGPNDPVPNAGTNSVVSAYKYSGRTINTKRSVGIYTLNPEYKIIPGLTLKANLAYRPSSYDTKNIEPEYRYINDNWSTTLAAGTQDGSISSVKETVGMTTVNAFADYKFNLNEKNLFSGVVGYNQETWKLHQLSGSNSGIVSMGAPTLGNTFGDNRRVSEQEQHWAVRGIFGRLNYILDDKYIFELNGRYDGSSKFPKANRNKFFPSYSVAWRISNEQFMESTKNWLNELKFRYNYGAIGNQSIANYAFYSTMASGLSGYMIGGANAYYVGVPGLVDPNFTWETAYTSNFGMDASFFKNKLNTSFEVYSRETKDIFLAGATYPSVLGASAPQKNSGVLRSNGWELTAGWRDKVKNSGLGYNVRFNIQDYKTKVVKFSGNDNNILSSLYSGMISGEIWGYTTDKILQEEDITNGKPNQFIGKNESGTEINLHRPENTSAFYRPGDILFKDINGDGKVDNGTNTRDNPGDKSIIGNNTPRLRWGLNLGLDYKGLDLTLFFDGIAKRDLWISDNTWKGDIDGLGNIDVYNNSWTPERTNAKYPVYNSGRGHNWNTQTGYLFNGAFVRLNQAVLGYTIPNKITQKAGISSLRVMLSGYNLFRISDIPTVYDPDLLGTNYPQVRSYSFGVQVGF